MELATNQAKTTKKQSESFAFKVDKTIEVTHVQLVATPMVPGGLVGADLSLNTQKVPGIKMYLQKDGMLWCVVKKKWFIIPPSNIKNYALSTDLEIE
jgi:hypothetical protein